MTESIFLADGERLQPTEHARGPWDPRALHGGAPAALIDGRVRAPGARRGAAHRAPGLRVPAPDSARAGDAVHTHRPPRPARAGAGRRAARRRRIGRRGGDMLARARCACSRSRPRWLPRLPRPRYPARNAALPAPESGKPVRFSLDGSTDSSFAATAMEMRWLDDPRTLGPRRVWMRLRHPLLPGQELTPLARLAATADFGNGVSAALPFERFLFINADLTIHLQRPPRGEWIGLDARTLLHGGGTGPCRERAPRRPRARRPCLSDARRSAALKTASSAHGDVAKRHGDDLAQFGDRFREPELVFLGDRAGAVWRRHAQVEPFPAAQPARRRGSTSGSSP